MSTENLVPTHVRVLALLLAVPLFVSAQTPRRGPVTIQLLAINDFHGNLEPPSGENGRIYGTPAGGAEYLASHVARAIKENPNSLVVAAGDLIGASPLLSALFHDEPTIEAMNAMHLSVSSVGNHEFDHGRAELLRMQRGGCHPTEGCQHGDGFAGARFQYLSANVIETATSRPLLPPTAVRTVAGVKIGFIGETFKRTEQVVPPTGVRGIAFVDEATTANRYAAELKRQGVDVIVLLIHEGDAQRQSETPVGPNGCANTNGALDPVLAKLSPDIKVVVSGHTHRFYNCTMEGRIVTSASSFGRIVTRIQLTVDPASRQLTKASAVNEIVTRDVEKDAVQTRLIAKYTPLAKPIADKAVGTISATLARRNNDDGESAIGDVLADAQLASTSPADRGGAQIAVINDGGIRADLVFDESAGGRVTFGQIFTVQPFGNVLTVRTMTGDMLKRLLEQQFDNPTPSRQAMLQISNGFSYEYSLKRPAGQRVDPASMRLNGRHIGPEDRVRVTANDFIATGGDSFLVLGEGTDVMAGEVDIDATISYLKAHSPVAPPHGDRIKMVD
jgi:5'-nucleotidase